MEPALAGALGRRDGARVGQLASLLADAGRSANVERLYIAARLPTLQVPPMWQGACPRMCLPRAFTVLA